MLGERCFMSLCDVIKNPFKCDLDHLLGRINFIKLWNFISFTSFLESASHTKAATAIPALLCTIAALKEKKHALSFLNVADFSQKGKLRARMVFTSELWFVMSPDAFLAHALYRNDYLISYCLYNYACFILILLVYRDDTIFVWHNCACTTSSSPLTGGGSFPPKRGFSSLTRYRCNIS